MEEKGRDHEKIIKKKLFRYQKELKKVSSHLKEVDKGCEFLIEKDNLSSKVHWAVDFHVLNDYLSPQIDMLLNIANKKIQNETSPDWMAANVIFSGLILDNLILLPPYKIEIEKTLLFLRNTVYGLQDRLLASITERKNKIKISLAPIKKILERFNRKEQLDTTDYHKVVGYIKENYFDLFKLLCMAIRDYSGTVDRLFKKKFMVAPSEPLACKIPTETLVVRSEETWFPSLCRIRPQENKRCANFLDALGLEYIFTINEMLREACRDEAIIFITGCIPIYKALNESGKSTKVVVGGREISVLQPPELFFTLLSSVSSIDNCARVREDSEGVQRRIKDFQSTIKDLLTMFPYGENIEYITGETVKIEKYLQSFINLDVANKTPKFQDQIKNHLFVDSLSFMGDPQARLRQLVERFLSVLRRDDLFGELSSVVENLCSQIKENTQEVGTMSSIRLKAYTKTRTPETSYMIEFEDEKIQSIHKRIIEGDGLDDAVEELFEIRNNMKKRKDHPEVFLLTAYLFEKEYYQPGAHRELDLALHQIGARSLRKKIQFIRNMVFCCQKNFKKALAGCKELIEEEPENPKYWIQKGFFIWRALRRKREKKKELNDYTLEDAINSMETACKLAKGNDCLLRVIYNDLSVFYSEAQKVKEANRAFSKLMNLKRAGKEGPLYDFAEAVLNFHMAIQTKDADSYQSYIEKAKSAIKKAREKNKLDEIYREYEKEIVSFRSTKLRRHET